MKWPSILLVGVVALLSNACEQHPASELEGGHGAEAHAAPHAGAPAPAHAEEKKAEEAKPGEAPKFFPDKK
jgi:hypothetical protein